MARCHGSRVGKAGSTNIRLVRELAAELDALERSGHLDQCLRLCEDRGLGLTRLDALEEQATLFGSQGLFEKAYRQHIAFHEADVALRAAEREANSRTLHAVFETEEARYEGERFREMALRDALTGLRNRRYVDRTAACAAASSAPRSWIAWDPRRASGRWLSRTYSDGIRRPASRRLCLRRPCRLSG
jgi:GGDEF domain-containing protein